MTMKKVLVVGATGNIARRVVALLLNASDVRLTLFVRDARRIDADLRARVDVVEGDALDASAVARAVAGHDVVYANLAGDLEAMAKNLVAAMKQHSVKRLIFIASIGIYDEPVKAVLRPYRKAADVIEGSGLDFTILRPTWFTDDDEVDYEVTVKGEPERGSVVSQQSVAALVASIIAVPQRYSRASIGVNKP